MSDDSIVLCVYFIVLGVVVIVGMGGHILRLKGGESHR